MAQTRTPLPAGTNRRPPHEARYTPRFFRTVSEPCSIGEFLAGLEQGPAAHGCPALLPIASGAHASRHPSDGPIRPVAKRNRPERRENNRIQNIQDSTQAGQPAAGVLALSVAFEQGFGQIADHATDARSTRPKSNQPQSGPRCGILAHERRHQSRHNRTQAPRQAASRRADGPFDRLARTQYAVPFCVCQTGARQNRRRYPRA